jgi:hypothetical protein
MVGRNLRWLPMLCLCGLFPGAESRAATIAYDTTGGTAAAGISSTDLTGLYGDRVTLTQTGILDTFRFSFFNSATGNTGSVIAGTTTLTFYDATAYSGSGALPAAIGSFTHNSNFGSGLSAGSFTDISVTGLSTLNIVLPQNVLVTQRFTQTSGTSTRYGTVINNTAPSVGSSGNTIFISNSANPAGYYPVGAFTNANLRYQIGIVPVPEPAGLAAVGVLAVAAGALGRRRAVRCRS